MQVTTENIFEKLVVLGTGGTIAGTASSASDNLGYTAAQLGVAQILDAIPGLTQVLDRRELLTEQVAQLDSKDMSFATWQALVQRVDFHLSRSDVKGIVITHGTDTLEETAYLLHAVLPAAQLAGKPVVLTCAMRPASSVAPDGPQNLLDALAVAGSAGACGVMVVCAGTIHGAVEVQKVHPYRLDAFDSGDAGALGYVEEACVRRVRNWPGAAPDSVPGLLTKVAQASTWPRVEIVMNYAGASAAMVDALLVQTSAAAHMGSSHAAAPLRGLVVAATGNGTVHQDLEAALLRAQGAGVQVVLATRCSGGRILPRAGALFPDSRGLSPVKARIALMLALMG
jgi:L-asparaginase